MSELETPEGWRYVDMGAPECGEDFCDGCGDCLACQPHDAEEWCPLGSRWVIYRGDQKFDEAMAKLEAEDGET